MSIQISRIRSILGANPIILVMKGLLILVLVWVYSQFIPILDFQIIATSRLNQLFETVRNILSYGLFWGLKGLWYLSIGGGMLPFMGVSSYNSSITRDFSENFFEKIIMRWFPELSRTDLETGVQTFYDYYTINIGEDFQLLGNNLYILVFQIIGILMIIYAVRSVLQTDPKYAIRTITYLNLMIFFPLLLIGIQEMIQVFNEDFNISTLIGLCEDPNNLQPGEYLLPYPLISNIIYEEITSNFGDFITSNIFQIALSSFIYLELSFQIYYIYQVTKPTEERSVRLKYQLEALRRAAQEAIVDIEKIKEKKKKEEEEYVEEIGEEGRIIKKKKKPESVRKFITQTATGFSFISEMIERRKLEEETRKLIEAKQDTRRLSNYINKLLQNDPEAKYTLTARTSAPTAGKLVLSTAIDMATRIGGITLLTFLVSQTVWFLNNVLNVPEALSRSVEMLTKEVILVLLLPLILAFPIISVIIRGVKQQNLREKLREEELRRLEAEGIMPTEEEEEEEIEDKEKEKTLEGEPVLTP
ncbi:MAG: hypothetical protein ACTSRZ_07130 [Promethearchaeota archaeon]